METTHDIKELEEIARQLRVQTLKVIHHAGSGHPGGSLSATDMITALYFSRLNHKPDEPTWKSRDRFVLSKGHCCPILY
ncbi:transketolase, partial [Candidatus Woesearchaeota archaeon CG11_big_fil_rev_8_21_14_0_20_57_5]